MFDHEPPRAPSRAPRFAVVGARRVRQGTGEFVARELARAGAEVVAVVGTSIESAEAARAALEERYGIRARAYKFVDDVFSGADPSEIDALAICSPTRAHEDAVEVASEVGLHCLCEKPLLSPDDRSYARARIFAERFAGKGARLATITQWPFVLPAFKRLFPDLDPSRAERFAMRMSPTMRGIDMVADAMSHPLSLLRALAGPGRVHVLSVDWEGDEVCRLGFDYVHAGGAIEAAVELRHAPAQPRPAWIAIDGRRAERVLHVADGYRMELASEERRVPLEDPLALLVKDFVARIGRGETTDVEAIVSDQAALEEIVTAAWRSRPAGAR